MVTKQEVIGYDNFVKYTTDIKDGSPPVFFFFSGTKANGKSWCPDCVEAEPILNAYLTECKKTVIFVYVDVGDRQFWANPQCPFRTDSRTKLMVIPTIIKWKGVQRLEGSQCNNKDLLKMMFEEEDQ